MGSVCETSGFMQELKECEGVLRKSGELMQNDNVTCTRHSAIITDETRQSETADSAHGVATCSYFKHTPFSRRYICRDIMCKHNVIHIPLPARAILTCQARGCV